MEEPDRPWSARRWLLSAALVVVVVVLYARTATDGLYLDDHHHVRPWTFREVLGTFHGPFDPLGLEPVYFRPLVVVTFALDWAAWGWDPTGFHITNIVLHAIACVTVFLLLLRLRVPTWTAFGSAGFFAAIPANVAAVVYISERSDVMVAIFTVLGLLALGRYSSDHCVRWLVILNVCYVLAIGSKEVGISMILSAALLWWYLHVPDHAPGGDDGVVGHWRTEARLFAMPLIDRTRSSAWLHVIGPMAAIAIATVAYRSAVLPTGALSERYSRANPVKGLGSAVSQTFGMVPWELAALGAPVLALLSVTALVLAPTSGGWRIASLGVFWVVATCVPLAWLGQVEPRLLYVAQIGVAMVLSGVLIAVVDAARARASPVGTIVVGVAAVLLVGLGAVTVRGTVDAQDVFAIGSPKMLEADLGIWTDTPERREKWPAHWMPVIRERLHRAGLIDEDGVVVANTGGE